MANELVAMSRFFAGGIPVNKESLAFDALKRVSKTPGSMFLMDDHTFEHFMEAQFAPQLMDRLRYDAWSSAGAQDMHARCNVMAKRILSEHKMKPKSKEVLAQIDKLVSY